MPSLYDLSVHVGYDGAAAEQGLAGLSSKVRSAVAPISGIASSAARGIAQIGSAALTTAAGGVSALGGYAAVAGAKFNILNQASFAAFKTILGSADAANKMMAQLGEFAKTSPFPKQAFITGTQQLLGFGLSAEKVIPTLQAIQDSVAAVGGGADDISNITYALAQIQGQGKLTGDTLNQLGQYGINAAEVIGKQMGITGDEVRKMASRPGGIPAAKVWDPLINGLEARSGGAAANVKKTFLGATDRIKAALRDIGSDLLRPFIGLTGGGALVDGANSIADAFRTLQKSVVPALMPLMNRLADRVRAIADQISDFVSHLSGADVQAFIDKIKGLGAAAGGAGAALAVLAGRNIPFIGQALAGISPLLAGFVGALLSTKDGRAAVLDVASALKDGLAPVLPIIVEAVNRFAAVFAAAIAKIAPSIPPIVEAIGKLATIFLNLASDVLPVVATAITGLLNIAGPVLGWLAQQAGLVKSLVIAWAAMKIVRTVGSWLGALPALLNPVGAAVAGLALVIGLVATRTDTWSHRMSEAAAKGKDLAKQARDTGKSIKEQLLGSLAETFSTSDSFRSGLDKMGVGLSDFSDIVFGSKKQFDAFMDSLVSKGGASHANADLYNLNVTASTLRKEYEAGTLTQKEYERGLKALGGQAGDTKDEFASLTDAISHLLDITLGVTASQDDFQKALNSLTGQVQDAASKGLNLNNVLTDQSDAAIGLRDNFRDLTQKATGVIQAWVKQGITGDDLRKRVYLLATNFANVATQAGLPKPVVDKLFTAISQLPSYIPMAFDAKTANAVANIGRLTGALLGVRNAARTVRGVLGGFFAEGGDVEAGKPIIVGEKGWEVFVPQTAGKIVSHQDALNATATAGTSIGGGGGGVTNVFYVQGSVVTERQLADVVTDHQIRTGKRNGGNVFAGQA